MVKELRKRFIAIAMASVGIVLLVLMLAINLTNYANIKKTANEKLRFIEENNGRMPLEKGDFIPEPEHKGLSKEAPFDTRFFIVSIAKDGSVDEVYMDRIAAVSEAEAKSFTLDLYAKDKASGYYQNYRYVKNKVTNADGQTVTQYVFVDCYQELRTFRSFLTASIAVSAVGLIAFFLLLLFFSKLVFRPVEESYHKQKRFITDASHEIKTPLTIIDANTEIIEMEHGEDEWTTSIRNQIKRLTDLTNKLVFLSRMDEENTPTDFGTFDLSDAVADTAEPFLAVAKSKDKELTLNIEEGLAFYGDEGQIRQAVSLLLDNAVKYANDKGQINVTLTGAGKSKKLLIYNTCDAIEPGKHDELFERFYRTDASRNSKTGGHGIGLSVVAAIVHAHRGKVSAKSEDGKSILFTITL